MERWSTLVPTKLHGSSLHKPTAVSSVDNSYEAIGQLPLAVVLRILQYTPIPDLPNVARCCRRLAAFVRDERLWAFKLALLDWAEDETDRGAAGRGQAQTAGPPGPAERFSLSSPKRAIKPPLLAAATDDDFGVFTAGRTSGASGVEREEDDDFGDFTGSADRPPLSAAANTGNLLSFDDVDGLDSLAPTTSATVAAPVSHPSHPPTNGSAAPGGSPRSSLYVFRSHHAALLPALLSLRTSPPSALLSHPSAPKESTLIDQAAFLSRLARFIHPLLEPTRDIRGVNGLEARLAEGMDYFEGMCLATFESADERFSASSQQSGSSTTHESEETMSTAAYALWELGRPSTAVCNEEEEIIRRTQRMEGAVGVWLERREIWYEKGWDPLANVVKVSGAAPQQAGTLETLDFAPMDRFMSAVLSAVSAQGGIINRVFPTQADVLVTFGERIANEVIGDYVSSLLSHTRSLSTRLYLQCVAAVFVQSLRLVDALLAVEPKTERLTKTKAEDIVYRMFEPYMDEYLGEERELVKERCEDVVARWDEEFEHSTAPTAAHFLTSENPTAVKRNVLHSFRDALLLPVTVVPRTVTYAVKSTADTISSLNPVRWPTSLAAEAVPPTYERGGGEGRALGRGSILDELEEVNVTGKAASQPSSERDSAPSASSTRPSTPSAASLSVQPAKRFSTLSATTTATTRASAKSTFEGLQLFLSLDVALQLIQIDRDCIKRIETFQGYPAAYGHRVREEIEEVFIAFLQVLGDKHIGPGFAKRVAFVGLRATQKIAAYVPAEHDPVTPRPSQAEREHAESGDTKRHETVVAPLVHFFELVHIGDTIQQMVQVYFDEEMAKHIDRTDFLNSVVREKKRFESMLDEAVAKGLNAGVDLLMGQAEHIISTRQDPRDFYPEQGQSLDLRPTRACRETVECLKAHCRMLVGSTDRQVLEVFYQEVGIRLHGIICKHLKRQIISLDGGFQVISDLNYYYAFVASLRQSNITAYFEALKKLGNVFIIDSAKDLGQVVRDASMYGGMFSPEEVYEFLRARCDFKAIEKAVDKEMYGFKASEDCIVC